jgi:hypothetical protein
MSKAKIKVRTTEAVTKEVFIDANDLLIDLMQEVEKATTEGEKKALKKIIQKIMELRKQSHIKQEL